ncbi:hypothetical protein DYB37_013670 [Aphanomyces astaci]|uniref:Mo25-like protein n=1 Tax=Aphanomyces astaci TaxID=112090 RepID=A0A3R7AS71_APHAT|nr:hypothetical protein DYB35_000413 [Aphanomyces astaci]RHZ34773.1 hypothetical protein DYB37_013670 [Aphanomyces astaci]
MSLFFWKKDVSRLTKSLHHLLHEVAPALPDERDDLDDNDALLADTATPPLSPRDDPSSLLNGAVSEVDVLDVDATGRVERLLMKIRLVVCGTPDVPIQTDECVQVVDMLLRYHVMERLVHPDLLVQISFEAQKSVGAIVKAMVHQHPAAIRPIVCQVSFLGRLCLGYACPATEVVLVCGAMLRDCLDTFDDAISLFLSKMPAEFDVLVTVACTHAHFDISSDALTNISCLLTHHTPELDAESDRVFTQYQRLLASANYATQRHALQILSKVLLDPRNGPAMMRYISDKHHLKVVMQLLREQSDALRLDAFHVFKIFVANPSKHDDIVSLLLRNRDKLLKFVVEFGNDHSNAYPSLASEIRLLVFTLEKLAEPATTNPPLPTNSTATTAATTDDDEVPLHPPTPSQIVVLDT